MRCYCCNKNLSDYEATLRSTSTGDFLDTCKKCLESAGIIPQESNVPENTSYYDEDSDDIDEWDMETIQNDPLFSDDH